MDFFALYDNLHFLYTNIFLKNLLFEKIFEKYIDTELMFVYYIYGTSVRKERYICKKEYI